jgi:hypothetical protein
VIAFPIIIVILLLLGYAMGNDVAGMALASSDALSLNHLGQSTDTGNQNETGVNVYRSDGSLTGSIINNSPTTWPGDDKIWNICAAVAIAEGYNMGEGYAPYDLNNPGDLSPGDEAGQATGGGPQVHDGSSIICFATAEGGWNALYAKFSNIVNGHSHVYPASWTWIQVASKYAGDSSSWLLNVTSYLGVDPTSTPAQYINS